MDLCPTKSKNLYPQKKLLLEMKSLWIYIIPMKCKVFMNSYLVNVF